MTARVGSVSTSCVYLVLFSCLPLLLPRPCYWLSRFPHARRTSQIPQCFAPDVCCCCGCNCGGCDGDSIFRTFSCASGCQTGCGFQADAFQKQAGPGHVSGCGGGQACVCDCECGSDARALFPKVIPGIGTITADLDPFTFITGTDTNFLLHVSPGDSLLVNGEVKLVTAVYNDTALKIAAPLSSALVGPREYSVLKAQTAGAQVLFANRSCCPRFGPKSQRESAKVGEMSATISLINDCLKRGHFDAEADEEESGGRIRLGRHRRLRRRRRRQRRRRDGLPLVVPVPVPVPAAVPRLLF